jgi:hypothetical protein
MAPVVYQGFCCFGITCRSVPSWYFPLYWSEYCLHLDACDSLTAVVFLPLSFSNETSPECRPKSVRPPAIKVAFREASRLVCSIPDAVFTTRLGLVFIRQTCQAANIDHFLLLRFFDPYRSYVCLGSLISRSWEASFSRQRI